MIQNLKNGLIVVRLVNQLHSFSWTEYINSTKQQKKRWHRACETTTVVVHRGSVGKESAISKFLLSWIEAKRICYGLERYREQNHVLELPLDLIILAVLDPSIPK